MRYYRRSTKKKTIVSVHPETGKVLSFDHTIPEDRPGAGHTLPNLHVPLRWRSRPHGMEPRRDGLEGVQFREDESASRSYLVWEARPGDPRNVDEAHFRVTIEVAGDQVVSLRSGWKIPEDYSRARSRQNALSIALLTLRIALVSFSAGTGLWLLIRRIRNGLVNWGLAIRLAIPIALIGLVGQLLSVHLAFKGYDSAIPLDDLQSDGVDWHGHQPDLQRPDVYGDVWAADFLLPGESRYAAGCQPQSVWTGCGMALLFATGIVRAAE